jgi:hypothetical protein
MLKKDSLSNNGNNSGILQRNQDNKMITVNRIFPNEYNTPRLNNINNRIADNIINTINTSKDYKSFVYRKSYIEKPKSVYIYNNNNNGIKSNKMITLENNSINDSSFFISPKGILDNINNTISFNYSNGKKKLKVRRKFDPVCQLHYKHNSVRNNHNKIEEINIVNKTPREEISVYKSKNYSNRSYYSNNNRNTNFLSSRAKTQLINSSSSTTLSYSGSLKNKIKKLKNNTLSKVKSTSHFSIDYSFDKRQPYVYKKTIISPSDYYSFDDIEEKEKKREREKLEYMKANNDNLNNININTNDENISLVTLGDHINDNNRNYENIFRKSHKYNKYGNNNNDNNDNNNKYIDKLKMENEFLKNELMKTNEKIFLLENKIDNLIEEKKISQCNKIKSKPFSFKKNSFNKCPEPTPYVQKFTKKDFFPKEQNIKVTLKSKDKIKPVIERIFRSYNNKKEKSKKSPRENNNIRINRINNYKGNNIIISSPNSIIKTKIQMRPNNKNKKFFHEFQNQIGFIIT